MTNVVGLIGAVTALSAAGASQAATQAPVTAETLLDVGSYADLLKPIPNSLALLREVNAARAREGERGGQDAEAAVLEVHFHHHHHHHHFFRD